MLVSQLIDKLKLLKKDYGNVEVIVDIDTFSEVSEDTIKVDDLYFDNYAERVVLLNNYDEGNSLEGVADEMLSPDGLLPSDK